MIIGWMDPTLNYHNIAQDLTFFKPGEMITLFKTTKPNVLPIGKVQKISQGYC